MRAARRASSWRSRVWPTRSAARAHTRAVTAKVIHQIQPASHFRPAQVRATHTTADTAAPIDGISSTPFVRRRGRAYRAMMPRITPPRQTKSSSIEGSGDEADAAGLLRPDLDVGERRRRDHVDLAGLVEKPDELGAALESVAHRLLDLRGGLGRLEGELPCAVDDADANLHADLLLHDCC